MSWWFLLGTFKGRNISQMTCLNTIRIWHGLSILMLNCWHGKPFKSNLMPIRSLFSYVIEMGEWIITCKEPTSWKDRHYQCNDVVKLQSHGCSWADYTAISKLILCEDISFFMLWAANKVRSSRSKSNPSESTYTALHLFTLALRIPIWEQLKAVPKVFRLIISHLHTACNKK